MEIGSREEGDGVRWDGMGWDGMTYLRTCCCSRGWGYGGRKRGTNERKGVVHHGEGGRAMFFFLFFFFSLFETRDRERERQERVRIQVTYFHLESFLEAMSTYLPTFLSTYCPLAV